VGSAPPSPTPSAPQPGATKVLEKAGITLLYVPAGEFLMGSTDSDPDAQPEEKPQHVVYLDGYWIGRTEVTNAQYRKFIEAGDTRNGSTGPMRAGSGRRARGSPSRNSGWTLAGTGPTIR